MIVLEKADKRTNIFKGNPKKTVKQKIYKEVKQGKTVHKQRRETKRLSNAQTIAVQQIGSAKFM